MEISNKEKNFISAVVYVHNNASEITTFLETLNEHLSCNFDKYEIICVNDGSTDNSVELIKSFSQKIDNLVISVLNMSYYQGIEMAMNAGVDLSIGDFVYEFDTACIDYEKDIMMKVYEKSIEGHDSVSAVANQRTKFSSRLFYNIYNKFSNHEYKLQSESFRIISRRGINRVRSISNVVAYRKSIYANCGLSLAVVNYNVTNNINHMISKQQEKFRLNTAIDSLLLFTNVGYKVSVFMTILMMIIAILVGIYTITVFLNSIPIAGWTTTMLFLSFSFFGVFAISAIIIKYLSILLNVVFKKKSYLIESIEKLTN